MLAGMNASKKPKGQGARAPGPTALRVWMAENPDVGIKAVAAFIGSSPCTASRLRNGTFKSFHADHLIRLEELTGGKVPAKLFVEARR